MTRLPSLYLLVLLYLLTSQVCMEGGSDYKVNNSKFQMQSLRRRALSGIIIVSLLVSRTAVARKFNLPTTLLFLQRKSTVTLNSESNLVNHQDGNDTHTSEAIYDADEMDAMIDALTSEDDDADYDTSDISYELKNILRPTIISPSLLASDWTRIGDEVARCIEAGATRFHVDIFDGVFLDSPMALTFGPQMVAAIRKSCGHEPSAILDLHLCVHRPARFVAPMAAAGASRFIFSWESCESLEEAIDLAIEVVSSGMACGVSVNPHTNIEEIFPLLETNMVDCVDVLAVEPGFGGQTFQAKALRTIARLRIFRKLAMVDFDIMVDGGINHETAGEAVFAGADILVSGSFLFKHPGGVELCMIDLLSEAQRYMR